MRDLSRRSNELEIMDAHELSAAEVDACLSDLAVVNTLTLARAPTLAFLRRAVRRMAPGEAMSVLDVGAGHGDMLRRIARWGARRGVRLRLVGLDLDPHSAIAAGAATPQGGQFPYEDITFETGDLFELDPIRHFDIVLSSLFTHHLTDPQIVRFLQWTERTARRGWFVNDLHRHVLAYQGFRALAQGAGFHPIVQHDGLLSVERSFRSQEWHSLLRQAGLDEVARVRWFMPFRLCVERLR